MSLPWAERSQANWEDSVCAPFLRCKFLNYLKPEKFESGSNL